MRRLFDALRISGMNLFRPQTTEPLPWKGDRVRAARYRASFAFLHDEHGDEACIGCRMCEKICPSQIITVVPGGRAPSVNTGKARGWCKDLTLDADACISCELCVQVCPTDALVMLRTPAGPAFSRDDLLLTMERLYANEKAYAAAWSTGTGLVGMQEPPKPPAVEKAPVAAPPEEKAPVAAPPEEKAV